MSDPEDADKVRDIAVPLARLTLEYGLNDQGKATTVLEWENLANDFAPVDMLIKCGLLSLAQQSLTFDMLGLYDDDEDE